jgi:glycosyltransferase involved in cell wall biosynthesis
MCTLDIVIPAYNEGKNIVQVLEALLQSVQTPFRILICYDHETDTTLKALQRYRDNPPFEIQFVKNSGDGPHGAVVSGFRCSTAESVLVMPADDTYNAGIIDQMVLKLQKGCDIVAASRFMPGGCMHGAPWLKAFLVRMAAFTLYHAVHLPTRDATNGFRLFSRRVLEEVEIESSQGFAYSLELLVKCHRMGWRIGEIPALWFERAGRKSRFRVIRWLPEYLRWYFYAFATSFPWRKVASRAAHNRQKVIRDPRAR